MRRILGVTLAAGLVLGLAHAAARAADDPKAVIDKAVKALGGADKLALAKACSWKSKGKLKIMDNEGNFSNKVTFQGLDHFRQEFEGDFDGNAIKGVVVLAGDKGWRKFGDQSGPLDGEALANQKRGVDLQVVPALVLPLTGPGFKAESVAEEKVDGKPANVLKIVGPDGKDFKLYFDKQSGLPVKLTATVAGFQGDEYNQESTYGDYKEFDGVKRATKVVVKRNGEKFIDQEVTQFSILDKIDPKTFAQ